MPPPGQIHVKWVFLHPINELGSIEMVHMKCLKNITVLGRISFCIGAAVSRLRFGGPRIRFSVTRSGLALLLRG
jgi:hypothetical protein